MDTPIIHGAQEEIKMKDQKRIFVSCEKLGNIARVETSGTLKDIVVLTANLLIEVGSSFANEGDFDGVVSPKDVIEAIASTAVESISVSGLSH